MSEVFPRLPDRPFRPLPSGQLVQYAWDSVSITAALACWRRYQFQIKEGWQPRGENFAVALNFGLAFHSGAEDYHNAKFAGMDHQDALNHTITQRITDPNVLALPTPEQIAHIKDEQDEDDDGITLRNSRMRTRYHLLRAVVWYLEHYADDPYQTVEVNGAAGTEVSFRLELPALIGGEPAVLSGHLDRVAEHNGYLYVLDYKTTKSISNQFFDTYKISHQLTGYSFAGKVVMDRPTMGVVVDGIGLLAGSVRFGREPQQRTEGQYNEYLETLQHLVFDQAERLAITHEDADYPMNTSSCYFCQYKQVCNQPPEYRRRYLKSHFEQRKAWNPLENR